VVRTSATLSAMPTRRQVLFGAAATATAVAGAGVGLIQLAEAGVVPGKSAVDQHLGYCDVSVPPARRPAGPMTTASFASIRRRTTVTYTVAYPPGAAVGAPLPVCLVLHGYGADANQAWSAGDYPAYLAEAVGAGTPGFALAAASGGNGYWHPHPGDDPLGMLLDEFLPLLARHGLRVDRPAVLGYSMGGFGALLCGLAAPDRFASIVASSPAFWRSYDEARHVNPGAFGSEADWKRYGDLVSSAAAISRLPAQIYVGAADSFTPAIRALRDRLSDPDVVHIAKGCHDNSYWRSQAPAQLRLIGARLAAT
jgi:S-formylglutathione hydrolase FrmB